MAGYSEVVRRPEKSNFSVTCSLLSQYIKEKGCPAELGFGTPCRALDSSVIGKHEAYRPPTTMCLLPGADVLGGAAAGVNDGELNPNSTRSMELFSPFDLSAPTDNKPEKAQLTIFYAGKVLVFDNFPAQKAQDLMQLASKGSSAFSGMQNFSFAPPTTSSDHPIRLSPANPPAAFQPKPPPKFSDLPIARKASLHRFLEKRKDRINAKAPYQLSGGEGPKGDVPAKEEAKQPWLGLGPQSLSSKR